MSIKVEQLTKVYGTQKAVDEVSFEVKPGEVAGFLGPNGAGKSTTMKIMTCFIPQTSGKAEVCGYDVSKDPMAVRQSIGYLPEHNPLYVDMYVKEYLSFLAGLHHIPNKQIRIKEMIELTGLTVEQHKKIRQLSKGYQQRVGLAQAMLHDPQVLILDEPTSGLDPNQLVEIRELIKTMGEQKTVLLSSHIMQEVQAVCDRVIIINHGKIVANDTKDQLQQIMEGEALVTVEFKESVSKSDLSQIKGVTKVAQKGANTFTLHSKASTDIRQDVSAFATEKKLTLLTIQKETKSLEDVFQQLTRKKPKEKQS